MTPEITLDTRFDEVGHSEEWRNDVAKELNMALRSAKWCTLPQGNAIRSICARVAHFEEIQVKQS